jgi:hypothetical protein
VYVKPTTVRAAFDASGRLRALIADGEETPNPLAFLDVPEGGEPLTRDAIAAAVAELDEDTLSAIIDAAVAEGQAIGASDDPITPEVLARINALADARECAEAQIEANATAAEEAQRARDEALARLTRPEAEDGEDGEEGTGDSEEEGADGQRTPEPVTAAGARRTRQTTALPRPGQRTGTSPTPRGQAPRTPAGYVAPAAQVALVAAAGLEQVGLSSGATIETAVQLGEAINAKRHAIRRSAGGDGEQITVASVRTTYPETRYLSETDVDGNTRKLGDVTSREVLVASAAAATAGGALVAAGGLCAPITQLYDVPVIGSAARPVRDALTNMGADRGGIKWRQHLSFGDFAGATGVWTIDNDEAVGTGTPPAPKPCLDVECPGDAEAYVEAITFCMTFSNVTARFDSEATAANVQAAQIAHARYAENRLMAQIAALSTTLTAPAVVSATRDILLAIDRLIAAHRNFYRLDDNTAFRMVLPRWVLDALRADLLLGAGFASGDENNYAFAVTDALITQWFTNRGVNITWHLDGRPATTAAAGEVTMADQFYAAWADNGAVPDFPAQVEALLWVEGEMIHLDGGTLDLGVVRDSTLNQNNRYKQFSETFEGVAHRGVEAIRLVADVQISGMTAGTADTRAILAA